MKRLVEDTLSLLVGAGVGLGAMYLFDPERGADRRKHLRRSAERALRDSVDTAHEYWNTGRNYVHSALEDAHRKYDDSRQQAMAWARQKSMVGESEETYGVGRSVISVVAGTVACLAIGAGLLALLDPIRRQKAVEQVRKIPGVKETEDAIRSAVE